MELLIEEVYELRCFTFSLGFQKDALKIGYSYDFTISGLSSNSGGAYEISLRIQLPCIPKKIILNPIKCPKFLIILVNCVQYSNKPNVLNIKKDGKKMKNYNNNQSNYRINYFI